MVQVQCFGTYIRYKLEFLHQSVKGLKLKVKTFWWVIPTFVEVTGQKLVGEPFCLPSRGKSFRFTCKGFRIENGQFLHSKDKFSVDEKWTSLRYVFFKSNERNKCRPIVVTERLFVTTMFSFTTFTNGQKLN